MMIFEYVMCILLGCILGSFLNVIIYRLPKMMKHEWEQENLSMLGKPVEIREKPFNLLFPQSHCTHCNTPIRPYHNIPLLSFMLLKGRCATCRQRISYRYPLIELLFAVITIIIFIRVGFNLKGVLLLILSGGLLVASAIDCAEYFIPDVITLPLLWLGLLANAFSVFISTREAILGAAVGYLFFWCTAKLFYLFRKKEGLGHGDFKLLALFGAWIGILPLMNIVILSCVLGLIVGIAALCIKKRSLNEPIPFGPFLAIAGWCTMLFGNFLINPFLK